MAIGQLARAQAELDQLGRILKTVDPSLPPEEVTSDWIKGILEARHRRTAIFGEGIFSDPGWDILLGVYALQLAKERTTITDVCRIAEVAGTTGLRWVQQLTRAGLLIQKDDRLDGRLVLLELSEVALAGMANYFRGRDPSGLGI
jgi:hypothetical protein